MKTTWKLCSLILLFFFSQSQAENAALKMQQCIQTNTDICISSVCRYTSTPNCQKECYSHAKAKCDTSSYDHQIEKKADDYDKVMDMADKLNFCIQQCHYSEDRNCSNKCKEIAKKEVKK